MTIWGANALSGHLIMALIGIAIAALDLFFFKRLPSVETMMGFAAFVIFPPLLLSAQGMDKESEELPLFVLTFATSTVFGIFLGMLIFAGAIPKDSLQSIQTVSTIWTLLTGIAVCVSYWTVGQMSRNQVAAIVAVYGDFPPHTKHFLCMLQMERFHAKTRKIVELLLTLQHKLILDKGGLLDQAVEKVCSNRDEEGKQLVREMGEQVRREILCWSEWVRAKGNHDGANSPSALKHLSKVGR